MAKHTPHRLGDLQLRILQILWARDAASVAEVHEELGGSAAFAYTTIATMLRKMEARKLVKHRESGRSYIFRATVTPDDVHRGVGEHFVDRLFAGSLTDAVCHLLENREVSREELEQIEKLIKERKRKK